MRSTLGQSNDTVKCSGREFRVKTGFTGQIAYDVARQEWTLKEALKKISARLVRPGVAGVTEQLDRVERRIDSLRASLEIAGVERVKYDGELDYWRYLVRQGGAEKDFGEAFEVVFARWMRQRLLKLGVFLGLGAAGEPGGIDDWCRERSVVEIGAGPYPACAAALHGWKRCVAVDPIARGYVEDGLVPASCGHVVYIEAPGERIPLPTGFADLVICENCLDHVSDPASVVREIERLVVPGGYVWFFVDLSNHKDHMHPHPMSEQSARALFERFEAVRVDVSSHTAHPEAYGGLRALFRRPLVVRDRSTAAMMNGVEPRAGVARSRVQQAGQGRDNAEMDVRTGHGSGSDGNGLKKSVSAI